MYKSAKIYASMRFIWVFKSAQTSRVTMRRFFTAPNVNRVRTSLFRGREIFQRSTMTESGPHEFVFWELRQSWWKKPRLFATIAMTLIIYQSIFAGWRNFELRPIWQCRSYTDLSKWFSTLSEYSFIMKVATPVIFGIIIGFSIRVWKNSNRHVYMAAIRYTKPDPTIRLTFDRILWVNEKNIELQELRKYLPFQSSTQLTNYYKYFNKSKKLVKFDIKGTRVVWNVESDKHNLKKFGTILDKDWRNGQTKPR